MRLLLVLLAGLLSSALAAPPARAMDIQVKDDQVMMSGPVVGNECIVLRDILDHNPIRVVVLSQSHGGNAEAGYCVGELVRAHQLATVIRGSCNSSCSRMWLGGVSRTLDGDNSRVGLHGNYDRSGDLLPGAPARLQGWIPNYAPAVNRQLMEQWTTLPHNEQMMFFYNTRTELCDRGRCSPMPEWNVRNAGLSPQ